MISRCTVDADTPSTRIRNGIDNDYTKELFIQYKINTGSSTTGSGLIWGFGVPDP